MSHVPDSVVKTLPKKPLNAYFKFRGERLTHYKDDEDRVKKVKDEWDTMDAKERAKLEAEYKESLEDYKKEMELWKAKHGVSDEDLKAIKGKDKENKKAEKSKGSKRGPTYKQDLEAGYNKELEAWKASVKKWLEENKYELSIDQFLALYKKDAKAKKNKKYESEDD
ncbi:uncharacterized protein LOC116245593 [Nymphaea colorata]|uniref:uncharacterized protein LOC116245593 n=1 Tax=Nymphaea colorata TaxID=210225 RepID=UPI00129DB000|nr:uncharacterized protein LOC116245593 [Nymphaea colorata]